MKKRIGGAAVLLIVLALTGCAASEAPEPTTESIEETKPNYVIGVESDNAPYYSVGEDGDARGLYVQWMDRLAESGDFTYTFSEMSAVEYRIDSDSCDLFLGNMQTETGSLTDFEHSEALYTASLCVVTKKDSAVKKAEDMQYCSVASRADTGEELYLDYLSSKYGAESIVFQRLQNVAEDLDTEYSVAAVMDKRNASWLKKHGADIKVLFTSEKYFSDHFLTASAEKGIPEPVKKALDLCGDFN